MGMTMWEGAAMGGMAKASLCVMVEGFIARDGGGNRVRVGTEVAGIPACWRGFCGVPPVVMEAGISVTVAAVVVCGRDCALAEFEDTVDATDGSVDTTCGCPPPVWLLLLLLLYAELTSSLSNSRSREAVN